MKKYFKSLSKTSIMHYGKLVIRGSFFLVAAILWLTGDIAAVVEQGILPMIVWLWYLVEMILRLFPSGLESMGCEKVFKKNYIPAPEEREPKNQSWKTTLLVAVVWFALNGAIWSLHLIWPHIFDKYFLVIVGLAYGVCDMICILFFCPFQTWFMKNRCCTTCRIYNWDFAMLCTPFLFVPSFYTWSLLLMSLVVLVHWEITYKRHPERFSERTNQSLRCQNCTEKLCRHKVQLKHYIAKHRDILFEKLEPIGEGIKETYGKAKEKTVEVYEKTKDFTKETYEKVKDKTVETYERAKEKTKDFTKDAYEKVKDRAEEVVTTVKDILGKDKDASAEAPSSPTEASLTENTQEIFSMASADALSSEPADEIEEAKADDQAAE